jgi:hypothetical protein
MLSRFVIFISVRFAFLIGVKEIAFCINMGINPVLDVLEISPITGPVAKPGNCRRGTKISHSPMSRGPGQWESVSALTRPSPLTNQSLRLASSPLRFPSLTTVSFAK